MRSVVPPHANVIVEALDEPVSVGSAVAHFCLADQPAILESSMPGPPYGRFSILAADPVDVVEFAAGYTGWPGRALKTRMQAYPPVADQGGGVHPGVGWIGYFSYESGIAIEPTVPLRRSPEPARLARPACWSAPLPVARFCLYDVAAVYDHDAGCWNLCAVDWPAGTRIAAARPPVKLRLDRIRQRLLQARRTGRASLLADDTPAQDPPATRGFARNMSYGSYLEKVARAKRYIEAGDIYQVNLTQRFSVQTDESPRDIYARLRRISPSSHAAFLQWNTPTPSAVISSSPELFLDLRAEQPASRFYRVVTRPIKGTRPRVGDAVVDAAYRRALIESEKDRAELNMIVDLMRNDLGRVCRYASVRVVSSDQIEEHPTVFHRVATIEGELDSRYGRQAGSASWLDVLEATFPGGSITGAPKIRAMQIIQELEPTPRGVYCGAIGHIGLDGTMSLSVAIRTMVKTGDTVHIHAGSAIVADSRAEDEHEEVMVKAAAMLRAVGCHKEVGRLESWKVGRLKPSTLKPCNLQPSNLETFNLA